MATTWKWLMLSLALLPMIQACTPLYLIKSDYVTNQQTDDRPEIIATAKYKELLPTLSTIAIRAPDSCANETTAVQSGEASARGLLLKTDCGVEMAALERALAKAGYNVVSWDIVKNRVSREEHTTPLQAAKDLGAQVLFQINSLERSESNVGQDARWERRFYRSSKRGEQRQPVKVDAGMKRTFESFVVPREKSALPEQRLSATINATATLVANGQSIWFYQWTHSEAMNKHYDVAVLLACKKQVCRPIYRDAKRENELFSGSTEAVSVSKRDANAKNAAYSELITDVLEELASSFAQAK